MLTHSHMHVPTCAHTCAHTHCLTILSLINTLSFSHAHKLVHTHSLAHSHSRTHSLSQTHTLCLAHSHSLSHSHTHSASLSHTHTQSEARGIRMRARILDFRSRSWAPSTQALTSHAVHARIRRCPGAGPCHRRWALRVTARPLCRLLPGRDRHTTE